MATDWTDLDFAFKRSDAVTDTDLVVGYEALLARMRTEAQGLDISTAQILRGSIVIGWFVKHQQTSRRLYGDQGAYAHPGQEKDAIIAWEAIAKDWDDILHKSRSRGAVASGVPVEVVRDAIVGVLKDLAPEERAALQSKFADAFERIGV